VSVGGHLWSPFSVSIGGSGSSTTSPENAAGSQVVQRRLPSRASPAPVPVQPDSRWSMGGAGSAASAPSSRPESTDKNRQIACRRRVLAVLSGRYNEFGD